MALIVIVMVGRAENEIDGMEQGLAHRWGGGRLAQPDEVVDKNVDVGRRSGQ